MKILRRAVLSALIISTTGYANDFLDVDASVSSLQQSAMLRWNIGSSLSGNTTPNILSELTYDDLTITGEQASISVTFKKLIPGLYLEGSALNGSSDKGSVQDSDYAGDGRTFEFIRSVGTAEMDVRETKAAIGYSFILPIEEKSILSAKIMLGLADSEQDVTMTNGVLVLDATVVPPALPALGPFAGLNSTYDAEWESKWLGLELDSLSYNNRYKLFYRAEYHRADYSAVADWNLRTDLEHPKSFSHEADGTGWVLQLGYTFYVTPYLGFHLSYDYEKWSAEDGLDTTYLSAGGTSSTFFREAVWETKGFRLGVDLKI